MGSDGPNVDELSLFISQAVYYEWASRKSMQEPKGKPGGQLTTQQRMQGSPDGHEKRRWPSFWVFMGSLQVL
jgi:hypothetical protein